MGLFGLHRSDGTTLNFSTIVGLALSDLSVLLLVAALLFSRRF
jgi:hypothetical protein